MKDNILIPKNDIQNRVRFLGEQIAKEYENKEPIFVGILKGSFIFLADLVRGVSIPLMIDFIEASSYEEKESSGNIRILKDLNINIENRHVIVVEDIIDTGNTLNHIIDNLFSRKPSSLKICSLFVKSKKHTLNYSIEYYGFEIEDHFVVGYGMDYKRNVPKFGIYYDSVKIFCFIPIPKFTCNNSIVFLTLKVTQTKNYFMAIIKPFKGIRPQKKYVDRVACKPYDVLNSEEAKMEARDNAISFLHVEKAEIDLPPETDLYDKSVYQKAKENFNKMVSDGIFSQDSSDSLYVYSQTWKGKTQFGLVGCASVEDYWNNIIKRHELTRPDKENDRKNHIETTNIQSGPIFLTYPDVAEVDQIISLITKDNPEYNFIASDEVEHTFWLIQNSEIIQKLVHIFEKIPSIYIADGHHRSASASIVGREKKENNPKHTGQEEYNFFLAVYFPASQLRIMDYNRVVKDLNGLNESEFLDKIKAYFDITQIKYELYKPNKLHEIGMYLGQKWYSLLAKEGTYDDFDPIGVLDVTILSKCILDPILGIQDLRRDKRIDFVGGIRGSEELKKRVDSNEMKVAFAMYPVSIEQLITISDTGNIMPPKTTWFEPKLRSGLVVHSIE